MANEPTQTQSSNLNSHTRKSLNPLQIMAQELEQLTIELGFTHSHQSPKAGEQGSQSPTRAYQVGFIPSQRTNQTQL